MLSQKNYRRMFARDYVCARAIIRLGTLYPNLVTRAEMRNARDDMALARVMASDYAWLHYFTHAERPAAIARH